MISFDKKTLAMNHVKENGGHVFACDINADGAKRFIVSPLSPFLHNYLKMDPKERMYNEMIPDDVPIKLYMDFEFKRKENPDLHEVELLNKIITQVQNILHLPHHLIPFQMDSSNDVKVSKHLIFPIVFRCKQHVKGFMNVLVDQLKSPTTVEGNICGLDLAVYDFQRVFRMLGSHKWAEPERKFIVPARLLDMNTLCDSLISVYKGCPEDNGSLPLTSVTKIEQEFSPTSSTKKKRKTTTSKQKTTTIKKERIEEPLTKEQETIKAGLTQWINKKYPSENRKIYSKMFGNKLSLTLNPGIYCPHAKRIHSSNSTWLNIDLETRSFHFKCADPQCRNNTTWKNMRIKDVIKT